MPTHAFMIFVQSWWLVTTIWFLFAKLGGLLWRNALFAEWWSNIFERRTFTSRSWHCCVGEDDGTPFRHIIPSVFSSLMPPQIYIPRPKFPFLVMLFPHFLGRWCFSGWYVWIANCCLGRNKTRRRPYYDRRWFQFRPWWCPTWWLRGFSWLLGFWCPKCSWRPVSKLGTTKWVANFEPPIGQPRYQRKLDVWKILWWGPRAIGLYHCGWESSRVEGMEWQHVAHWIGPSMCTLLVDMEGAKK